MRLKKILALTLSVSALLSSSLCISADAYSLEKANNPIISVQYVHTNSTWTGITASGTTAYINADIEAYSDVTKVVICAVLQKKVDGSWTDVKTWTCSADDNSGAISASCTVESGYTYRVKGKYWAYVTSSDYEFTVGYSGTKSI